MRADEDHDTIGRRLRRLVVAMIISVVVLAISGIATQLLSTRTVNSLARGIGPAHDSVAASLTQMLDAETGLHGYLATGDRSFLGPYERGHALVRDSLTDAQTALHRVGNHSYDDLIDSAWRRADLWLTTWAAPLAAANPAVAMATPLSQLERGKALFDDFRTTINAVGMGLGNDRADLRDEAILWRNLGLGALAAVGVAITGIALLLGLRTSREITEPLTSLEHTVHELEAGDLTARSSAKGPREITSLSRAINLLGTRAQADAFADQRADDLVSRVRYVISGIRRIDDPPRIAALVTKGLGIAFEADHVWLFTYEDERVPKLSTRWQREGIEPLGPALDVTLTRARQAVERQWNIGRPVVVDNFAAWTPSREGSENFEQLKQMGVTAAIFVPFGDANSPFGVLTIGMVQHPRSWTSAEAALAHAVGADVAHSLSQASVISRQREAMDRLHELDRAKSEFVSNVTHGLRTPLTSITGYVEMLQDGAAGELPSAAKEMIDVIDRNAMRLRDLIDDLLAQSGIEAGMSRLTATPVDLRDVLRQTSASMQPQANSAGVTLTLSDGNEPLAVAGDAGQLEEVFQSLVSNAVKFSSRGGIVHIDAELDPEGVVVCVADTGMGIPESEQANLFTRFFRASNATQAGLAGTGLGLAIVRDIVRQHGGEVDLESREGVGTTFTVLLPSHPMP